MALNNDSNKMKLIEIENLLNKDSETNLDNNREDVNMKIENIVLSELSINKNKELFKFYNKKAFEPNIKLEFYRTLEITPDDVCEIDLIFKNINVSSSKYICLLMGYFIENKINIDFKKDFGSYPSSYCYENFKKLLI